MLFIHVRAHTISLAHFIIILRNTNVLHENGTRKLEPISIHTHMSILTQIYDRKTAQYDE